MADLVMVPAENYGGERGELAFLHDGFPMMVIRECELARGEHERNRRQYAHMFHHQIQRIIRGVAVEIMCVAPAFFELSPGNRSGLVLHEYGHLLAKKNDRIVMDPEIDADLQVERITRRRIFYDRNKVQTLLEGW